MKKLMPPHLSRESRRLWASMDLMLLTEKPVKPAPKTPAIRRKTPIKSVRRARAVMAGVLYTDLRPGSGLTSSG